MRMNAVAAPEWTPILISLSLGLAPVACCCQAGIPSWCQGRDRRGRQGRDLCIRGCPAAAGVRARARHQLRDAPSYGISVGSVDSDISDLLQRVRAEVDRLNTLHLSFLSKAGVELIRGWGRFTGPHSLGIASQRDGTLEHQITASRLLIAVGGRPVRPPLPGAAHAWISDDMFELKHYPDSVVVVGAGFIACEFACILRGLGLSVTVVVRGERLLRGFDQELADAVLEGVTAYPRAIRRDCPIHPGAGDLGWIYPMASASPVAVC